MKDVAERIAERWYPNATHCRDELRAIIREEMARTDPPAPKAKAILLVPDGEPRTNCTSNQTYYVPPDGGLPELCYNDNHGGPRQHYRCATVPSKEDFEHWCEPGPGGVDCDKCTRVRDFLDAIG